MTESLTTDGFSSLPDEQRTEAMPEAETQVPSFYPEPQVQSLAPQQPGTAGKTWIKYPPRLPVTVLLQPEERSIEIPKAKTVRAVLAALGLKECTAIVARDGSLLTPDRAVAPGDTLLVRKVTSSG